MDSASVPPGPAPAKGSLLRPLGKSPGQSPRSEALQAGRVATDTGPRVLSLNWAEQDIENRWGLFQGGRYTNINKGFSFLLAAISASAFMGLMVACYHSNHGAGPLHRLGQVFVRPNNLPATIPATLFFFWGSVTSILKIFKLRLQRRALDLAAVPQSQSFVLNEATARTVLDRMRCLVDDTRHFILLNRIDRALSSLHNIGGVSDVSAILKSQADNDENHIASSYALIHAMIWAIPVLGFVGTVLGLSLAMQKFNVDAADAAQMRASLGPVVSGLSTAFETTLVGLIFALLLHLLSDLVQQKETAFMDECNDYCHAHVVSKLRVRKDG